MTHAIRAGSGWALLPYGETVTSLDSVAASYATVMLWSDGEREAFGVFAVPEPDAPPAGQMEAGRELVGKKGRPIWAVTYQPIPPPGPEPVPEIISARQFFQQLAKDGACTQAEALAYVQTGALPAALSTVIDSLPEDIRFDVRMEVIGANEFERSKPTVDLLGYLLGMDAGALDRIWRLAVTL